ncbi:MAG TPA: NAD(P)-dependent oxidoreductase [Terriglobales bacterium]|jgi:D-lactate dehydrogenase|nr:NAD(P)-dependent oxidoreductase [Terriglobales bacterium]
MNVQLQSRVPQKQRMAARIVFFDASNDDSRYFSGCFDGLAAFHANPLDPDHLQQAEGAEIVVVSLASRITAGMLRALPGLKLIATRSSSFDHIDFQACEQHRITVCNVPTYGSRAVAEFAFGLIIMLARRIGEGMQRVRDLQFNSFGLRGFDLQNKTIGVIGTGHIGREVIRLALAFNMHVLACDIKPDLRLAEAYKFAYVALPELLRQADIITLHVPYYEGTHHLLNRSNFNEVKPGALLVNTSRGAVIETAALMTALYSGALGGAALDVIEEELAVQEEMELLLLHRIEDTQLRIVLENHALVRMPNVILTPHIAFNSREAVEEIWKVTERNIQKFLQGHPQNVIEPESI